jgi:hypothetical protein
LQSFGDGSGRFLIHIPTAKGDDVRRGRAPAAEVAESAEEADATVDRGWLWHGDGFSLLLKLERK